MTSTEISNTRLISQKIEKTSFKTTKEIVRWMGAIQAQDYPMAKWALGTRLTGSTEKDIESSLDTGEVIRIHVLRPTWHFVAADDAYWMLQLSAPKIKSSMRSRNKELGLTESVISKTNDILRKNLSNGLSLTRDELADEFHKAKIQTEANRLSHILFSAEMDGILCSGPLKNNKQTYSLLYERVPCKNDFSRDEALAELAKRYFNSRCPATLEDFIWWSNLSATEARKAMDMIKQEFVSETIGSCRYFFPNSFHEVRPESSSVHLLPAFDEFLISYKDRSSSLSLVHNKKAITNNGIFHPHIVINGQVTGLWKRTFQTNKVLIETRYFESPDKSTKDLIEMKAGMFGRFLNKESVVAEVK
jgi:hypothetical protein